MWKEIDDKTFGKGFDCFAEDAVCNLGVADWHGRETIRNNLRAFIDKGFTALHDVSNTGTAIAQGISRHRHMTFDDPKCRWSSHMTQLFLHGQSRSHQGKHWYGSWANRLLRSGRMSARATRTALAPLPSRIEFATGKPR